MVNTIKNEKLHAVSTENVTIGCCRWMHPYRHSEIEANSSAKQTENTNR